MTAFCIGIFGLMVPFVCSMYWAAAEFVRCFWKIATDQSVRTLVWAILACAIWSWVRWGSIKHYK